MDVGRRKRKTADSANKNKDSVAAPTPTDSTGRPKRRCTSTRKVITDETDLSDSSDNKKEENYSPVTDKVETEEPEVISDSNGVVVIDPKESDNKLTPGVMKKVTNAYKWMDHDEDTSKIRCKTCVKANLRKWFILSGKNVDSLLESLKLHQMSEEHGRARVLAGEKTPDAKVIGMSNKSNSSVTLPPRKPSDPKSHVATNSARYTISEPADYIRDVYCLPVDCKDPLPIPDIQLHNLLEKHGLKARVRFLPNLSPAKLREDISKAFSKTFKLRMQELLQFDYLALTEDKNALTRPHKLLHFDGETVLSFVGKINIYVLLKQNSPIAGINWKQLLFQEENLRNLNENEYKEVMLNVMYRLSSGKHKKDSSASQKKLVESLLNRYRLNNFHQLVYAGNELNQLVLFTNRRREEAYTVAHGDHLSLMDTFNNVFKLYYWNNIVEWVTDKVKSCSVCAKKYGDDVTAENVSVSTSAVKLSATKSKVTATPKFVEARTIRTKPSTSPPREKQEEPGAGEIVPLPVPTTTPSNPVLAQIAVTTQVEYIPSPSFDEQVDNQAEIQTVALQPSPSYTHSKAMSQIKHVQQAVVNPVTKVLMPVTPQPVYAIASLLPPPPMKMPDINQHNENVVVKAEPIGSFEDKNLLPPVDVGGDNISGNIGEDEDSGRDMALYEEDLEQAIQQNTKNADTEGMHCTNAMWAMYFLQQRGTYCDFFIMLLPSIFNGLKKPKIYGLHKVVFSAISKRIRKISKTTIKIGGKITCEGLESVIEYGYTGRLTGIQEMQLRQIKQISTTSLALDIDIIKYLQKYRPDFVKSSSAKILVSNQPPAVNHSSNEHMKVSRNEIGQCSDSTFSPFVET